jgi:hypothetical protein
MSMLKPAIALVRRPTQGNAKSASRCQQGLLSSAPKRFSAKRALTGQMASTNGIRLGLRPEHGGDRVNDAPKGFPDGGTDSVSRAVGQVPSTLDQSGNQQTADNEHRHQQPTCHLEWVEHRSPDEYETEYEAEHAPARAA